LLSNPIRNLRPSRRLLSHVHSNSEARVSASRLQIDLRIARYKHIASRINDRIALDGIAELIDAALAKKAAIHSRLE
ncbi:hypothetical protein, partial [Bradyrhizobium sp. 177]|uniref:hypothetical protein n=1 Tax=Bradyrhizobium sp. 177 TaxID=2782647 RepID=UPI001FF9BECE